MRVVGPIFAAAVALSAAMLIAPPPPAEAGVTLTWHRKSNPGPSAREQAGRAARQQINAAQANFNRAYAEAMRNHPLNTELKQARADVTRAHLDLTQTLRNTRAKAGELPEIQSSRRDVERLQRSLDGAKDASVRLDIARELLESRKKLTQLEYDAIEGDVYVVLARATVQESTNKLRGLEGQFQTLLVSDPGFAAAKQQLDDARKNLLSLRG